MGCCTTKPLITNGDSFFQNKILSFPSASNKTPRITSLSSLQISDMLFEKQGSFLKDYELLKETISSGHSSTIKKGIHKLTGTIVAIKMVRLSSISALSSIAQKNYLQGLTTLKKMDHPSLIRLLDIYEDEHNINIITEYYSGGELFEKLLSNYAFSEIFLVHLMKNLLMGLNYLHLNNIIHRGITPENIVFEGSGETNIKIIDFKLLTLLPKGEYLYEKVGATRFIAPEILSENGYDFKCDIWASGILMYLTLFGRFPFEGDNAQQIFEKIKSDKLNIPTKDASRFSPECIDFLQKILEKNPKKRLSAQEALAHKWIEKNINRRISDAGVMMGSLKRFKIRFKLEKIFWLYLLNFFLDKKEKEALSAFFEELDETWKGYLNKDDLIKALRKRKKSDSKKAEDDKEIEKEVDEILNTLLLKEGNAVEVESGAESGIEFGTGFRVEAGLKTGVREGRLCFSDFLMATIDKKNFIKQEKIQVAFSLLDKEGKGRITIEDLKREFAGNKIEDDVWKEMIEEVTEKEGCLEISYEDFERIIMRFK